MDTDGAAVRYGAPQDSNLITDPQFQETYDNGYSAQAPVVPTANDLFGSAEEKPGDARPGLQFLQVAPNISHQGQQHYGNGLAFDFVNQEAGNAFIFDGDQTHDPAPQPAGAVPFAVNGNFDIQQTPVPRKSKPTKKGEVRLDCRCSCGCSSRFYPTLKMDNSRCPPCRKAVKPACTPFQTPSTSTDWTVQPPPTAHGRIASHSAVPGAQISNLMSLNQQDALAAQQADVVQSAPEPSSTSLLYNPISQPQAPIVKHSRSAFQALAGAGDNHQNTPAPIESGLEGSTGGPASSAQPGCATADLQVEGAGTAAVDSTAGTGIVAHQQYSDGATHAESASVKQSGELRFAQHFRDEASADRYLAGDRNQVSCVALNVKNDDMNLVSDQRKFELMAGVYNSMLAAPAAPPAELTADEQTKFSQRQNEALVYCKDRMADEEGQKRAIACVTKLYYICERAHKYGIPSYALKPSRRNRATSTRSRYHVDWDSTFTTRMAKVTDLMDNKRAAIDLLSADTTKLEDMVFAPDAYLQRKIKNFAPNEEKNEALRIRNAAKPKPTKDMTMKRKTDAKGKSTTAKAEQSGELQYTALTLPDAFDQGGIEDASTSDNAASATSSDSESGIPEGKGKRKRKLPASRPAELGEGTRSKRNRQVEADQDLESAAAGLQM